MTGDEEDLDLMSIRSGFWKIALPSIVRTAGLLPAIAEAAKKRLR